MSYIPFVLNQNSITFHWNHKLYMISDTAPGYQSALDELKSGDPDPQKLIEWTKPIEAIRTKIEEAVAQAPDYLPAGRLEVTLNDIRYNGVSLNGVLVDRILAALAAGFDIMPSVKFLENLMLNPADFAREELYLWLEKSNLPITEDGHFLAYKRVRSDFTSLHDSVTDNSPGTVVSMPRQDVDPNRDRTCSRGLHFCSKDYLPHFGSSFGNKIVILKINPADVVSIPSDYDNSKGRAWKYLVLAEFDEDPQGKQWDAVVSATGDTYAPPAPSAVRYENPDDAPLVIGSELAKSLFAACNEIGLTDREDRLDWAADILFDDDTNTWSGLSFNDLSVGEAKTLLEVARTEQATKDDAADRKVADAAAKARQAQLDAINGYGIITLRRKASEAGLPGAWKGYKARELRNYLIGQIK